MNPRFFGSNIVCSSLWYSKLFYEEFGRGLAVEFAKTRERVRVSNVRDMRI